MLSDCQDGSEGSRSSKSNSTIANNLEFVVLIFVPVGNLVFESTYSASWLHCEPHLIGCGDITFRLASIPFKKEWVIKSSSKIFSVVLFKLSLEISKFFVFKRNLIQHATIFHGAKKDDDDLDEDDDSHDTDDCDDYDDHSDYDGHDDYDDQDDGGEYDDYIDSDDHVEDDDY